MANWGYLEQVMNGQGYADSRKVMADIQALNRTEIGRHLTTVDIDYATFKVKASGTIPVVYNGNTYHIPLAFYIDQRHPYVSPKAYVEPAPGMMLNVVAGSAVRHDGLVTHDFFDRWNSSSSLQSCCETLAYAFGQVSPVVAAPAGYVPPPRPQQQQQQQQQPHRPPQTGGGGAAATSSSSWAPPAYPRDEGKKPVRTPSVEDPRIQEAMRASEKSAVLDNVSRKIRAKLGPRHRRATEVITKATARQSELARRTTDLDGLRKRGETDIEQVRRAVQWYGAELPLLDLQVQEFEQHASDLESHERTVVATAPLYDQYISLLTKYNSIEDTLLTLKSVHNAANFTDESLKAVLNQIRDQSRKQFKALFMLQKVRTAAMIK